MESRIEPPSFHDLVDDLLVVRKEGITALRSLELPALARTVRALGHVRANVPVEAPALEHAIRTAIAELGGGAWTTCAAISGALLTVTATSSRRSCGIMRPRSSPLPFLSA